MKHVVSFSGGRTSAYLVYLMQQRKKSEGLDVEFIFCDTGAEHPETYNFIRSCAAHFEIDLICLRSKFSQEKGVGLQAQVVSLDEIKPDLEPFSAMIEKHGVPYYPMGRQCTGFLKTDPFTKYCNEHYGKDGYTKWLGIRADEPRRLKPKDGVNYLADISDFEKPDILSWWEKMPFDLKVNEWLGNCMFCIQKKVSKVALAAMDEPEHAKRFVDMVESKARRKKGKQHDAMYQHDMSLDNIIKVWKDFDRDEVMQRMVRGKRTDTGSCSESCEPFQDELFPLEYK